MRAARATTVAAILALSAGCSNASPLAAPADDAELVDGQQVYASQCASCHGVRGEGGRGSQLSEGQVLSAYPDPTAQLEIVANGTGQMPAYGNRLTEEQLAAVIRYTREVINPAEVGR